MIHYPKKVKTFGNVCERFLCVNNGETITQKKRAFETLDLAIAEAKRINASGKNIHKVVAYKCNFCFKYHVGKNGTKL